MGEGGEGAPGVEKWFEQLPPADSAAATHAHLKQDKKYQIKGV